ncbi:MAG: asparagine synthase-related protein [Gemmatimonadota bacterium]|nr:asparagine synthase-related protein [Gemmatimonadota bacterium]
MTAILGIFSSQSRPATDADVRQSLSAMGGRGGDRIEIWRDTGAVLAVARHEWETAPSFGGAVAVAVSERHAVVADAGLYYRGDLRRALAAAGIRAAGESASELILAAYEAWGDECCARLEGDFAFIVWDRKERRALCARDFVGMRSLYYADLGTAFLAATTIGGVVASPRCPTDLNWFAIGNAVARLFAASHESCYRAVQSLLAGHSISYQPGRGSRTWRHWEPPAIATGHGPPFEEAAIELRRLLMRAIEERIPSTASACVWLSGGYDSTALFAAGQQLLRPRGEEKRLRAVSMSYPEGDPGNEDATIQSVADFWGQPVEWVRSDNIPMFGDDEARAAARDDVFAHPFENWQRAISRGSRAVGARVALQGIGGDELFAGTDLYLADYFRQGRWPTLMREWRQRVRRYGFRYFAGQALVPSIPPTARRAIEAFSGRTLPDPYAYHPPTWMRPDFIRRHALEERDLECTPTLERGTFAAQQLHECMTHPAFGVVRPPVYAFGVEEGVDIRVPLYDRRIVEFAAPRPLDERISGRESKRLLRASVRGMLPDEVLAPRSSRTGLTSGYFDRWMRQEPPAWFASVLDDPVLARLGIIDPVALRRAWSEYLQWGNNVLGTHLFATFETELWLRANQGFAHETAALEEGASQAG